MKHHERHNFRTESIQNIHKHKKFDFVPPIHPTPNQIHSKPAKGKKESHFSKDLEVYIL